MNVVPDAAPLPLLFSVNAFVVVPPLPLDAAVTCPLALTVMVAFVNEPTLEFTVASVAAHPEDVKSPVNAGSCPQATEPLRFENPGCVCVKMPVEAL